MVTETKTKQEEIVEGLMAWMGAYGVKEGDMVRAGMELFQYLHSQGLALKVEGTTYDNPLMRVFHEFDDIGHNEKSHGKDTRLCPRCQLLKFMLAIDNAGYTLTKDLI